MVRRAAVAFHAHSFGLSCAHQAGESPDWHRQRRFGARCAGSKSTGSRILDFHRTLSVRRTLVNPGACDRLAHLAQPLRRAGTCAARLLHSRRAPSPCGIFNVLPNRFRNLACRRCRDVQFVWAYRACDGSAFVKWCKQHLRPGNSQARSEQRLEAVCGYAGRSGGQCNRSARKPDGDP